MKDAKCATLNSRRIQRISADIRINKKEMGEKNTGIINIIMMNATSQLPWKL